MKKEKKARQTEYGKIKDELDLMAGQPNGWINIEKKLSAMTVATCKLTENDISSLKDYVAHAQDERKKALKLELDDVNEFFKQDKEHPTMLRQFGLYKKGLSKNSPMYDSLIESSKMEIKELKIMLSHGFDPVNAQFKWQADPEWQEIRKTLAEKKKAAMEKQLKDVEEMLVVVEEEIAKEKGDKDKRVAQIKEELKELGEKFPKDELSYIG